MDYAKRISVSYGRLLIKSWTLGTQKVKRFTYFTNRQWIDLTRLQLSHPQLAGNVFLELPGRGVSGFHSTKFSRVDQLGTLLPVGFWYR